MADININAIAETLNNKMDKDMSNTGKVYLKTTYVNGVNGYRIWSDGYCEQWGTGTSQQYNTTSKNVTFSKTFADTNFNALVSAGDTTQQSWQIATRIAIKYVDGLDVRGGSNADSAYKGTFHWRAFGYLKAGTY